MRNFGLIFDQNFILNKIQAIVLILLAFRNNWGRFVMGTFSYTTLIFNLP